MTNNNKRINGKFAPNGNGDQAKVLLIMKAIYEKKGKKHGATSKEIHQMYEEWFGAKPKTTISSVLNILEYGKFFLKSRTYYSKTHVMASGIHKNAPEKIREYAFNYQAEKQIINPLLKQAKEKNNADKKLQKTIRRTSEPNENRFEESL